MDTASRNPLKNTSAEQSDALDLSNSRNNKIYMSIDHLKKGTYSLNILEKEKVIRSIKINKR